MQTKVLLFSLFLLTTKVLAGGYSGALEQVWLFYAYQIDGLNDPADRKLGWKCQTWDETTNPQKCKIPPGWMQCRGSLPNNRCRFDQLLNQFGGGIRRDEKLMVDSSGRTLPLEALNPDPERTATMVYRRLVQANAGKVPDVPGYRYQLQGSEKYISSISAVSNVVVDTFNRGKQTPANKYLFEMFAKASEQVRISRVGDQGRYLIQTVQNTLNMYGITVATQPVGSGRSPVNPTMSWNTVDWQKTTSNALAAKIPAARVQTAIAAARQAVMSDQNLRKHTAAITAFMTAERRSAGCI
ncbi:hypothetical protein SAMD00023353_5200500 [Rosellinia necatrix]|uniref:Uncharacterized protein n=1 Tax=Rosellinia necatrix TaxID=77044 RepID=A0A1W2TQJ9_ROSNE|nr:hypothetical protein SAMD00023353_5200500 [Rosellinia necatrix]